MKLKRKTNHMFDLFEVSLADCKRHLTNSVGHRTNEAKKAADEPARAFSIVFKSSTFFFATILQIPF
jgi:hypothetical protein